MSGQDGFSRRELLKIAGAGAGVAALGGITALRPTAVRAQDQKYAGTTLRGLTAGGGAYNPALVQFGKEFEEQTGAKVEWDEQPWEQLMPKIQADLAAGSPTYDIFCNDVEFQYTIYPYLQPINDFITSRAYNMDGFFEPIYKYGEGVAGGQAGVRYGLPIRIGASWVFYRTDLISEFPTTWADYEAALAANTGNGKYGLSFAGVPAQLVKLFLARYWYQGDPLLTPDWKPLINSDKGVAAVQRLFDNMKKYAPPGILAWDNPDASNAFLNGDVAVLEGWSAFIQPSLQDPAKSKVVDKWSVARYPENGTGNITQHNLVIFKTAKNADAAFDYIAYCTGLDNAKRLMLEFKEESPRKTVWADPEVAAAQPYLVNVASSYDLAKPFTPGLPQWLEMFIGLAEGLSSAMSEQKSPQDALNDVAKKWEELIKQAPPAFEYKE
jgi:multiple sugar transport system substrate-binding protein